MPPKLDYVPLRPEPDEPSTVEHSVLSNSLTFLEWDDEAENLEPPAWEDETGYVRSKARKFTNKGQACCLMCHSGV